MSKFKIGDKVILSPDSQWVSRDSTEAGSTNPLNVEGVIYKNYSGEEYEVKWSNSTHNYCYTDDDLILVVKHLTQQTQYECPYAVIEELQCHVETLEEALEKVTKELIGLREKVNSGEFNSNEFKPISEMTMEDWRQALKEGWVFEMGDGEEVVVDSIMGRFNDPNHPVELSSLTGEHEATVTVKGYFWYDRPDHHRNVKQRIK